MPVGYKKILKKNPLDRTAKGKYYPHLVNQGNSADLDDVAFLMKETSSLTLGDIQSVLSNLAFALRLLLYGGQSVNIKDFGVFSLGASCTGSDTAEECGVKNIEEVYINFRASTSQKPNLESTRAGDRIKFFDVKTGIVEEAGSGNSGGSGGDGGDEFEDPTKP